MEIPEDKYSFRHAQPIQMRFNDLDALQHVNNTIYLEYMDFAKTQYITEVLAGVFDIFRESLVIVNVNCEFYEITRYGEPIEVLSRVDKISAHSVVFVQRVANRSTGHVKAIARTVMVGFNIADDCKMEIPSQWTERINAYEGRDVREDSK